jgi:hypothetical protein
MKIQRLILMIALAGAAIGFAPASGSSGTPLFVKHIRTYPGGISGSVRARVDGRSTQSAGSTGPAALADSRVRPSNVKATNDRPNLPQNETSVALDPDEPLNAVGGANDWVGLGLWIGNTSDGGRHWASTFKDPLTSDGGVCFGADPSVAYSVRDSAFYLSTLCYWFDPFYSGVQLWKSVDGGATWTPSERAAVVNETTDPTVFYDKELVAIDNNPSSPHYGRIYVTYIKFHMLQPDGRSDYCPVQVGYSDAVPTEDPSSATWTNHSVVPDDPGAGGKGPSANQWAMPVVDDEGALNVAYAIEECNTSLDHGFFFVRSTDGATTFSPRLKINKPGQFQDNADAGDALPPKTAGIPISPSLAFNAATGTLGFAYQNNVNAEQSGADISFQRSTDHGATWSDATFLATAGGGPAPNDQFFPWLATDESGRWHAMWFDNRNDPGNLLIETFQGLSSNDGLTWSNFDISSEFWDPNDSFFDCGCFIGDYSGIAASDAAIYPLWTDGRDTPGFPDGATDIFVNVELAE